MSLRSGASQHKQDSSSVSPKRSLRRRLKHGETPESATAQLVVEGIASNVLATVRYSEAEFGHLDLTECMVALGTLAHTALRANSEQLQELLAAQVVTLNAIFANLVQRASRAEYVDHFDRYLRLAFKAQGQARATVETLSLSRNPTIFARQANIAHGPQQVNNERDSSRPGDTESMPNEVLEVLRERLDGGPKSPALPGHSELEALGAVNRSTNRGRKGPIISKCEPR